MGPSYAAYSTSSPERVNGARPTSRPDAPYSVIIFKATEPDPKRYFYDDAIVAMLGAVEFLKSGYQVRLSDGCVEWFGHNPDAARAP